MSDLVFPPPIAPQDHLCDDISPLAARERTMHLTLATRRLLYHQNIMALVEVPLPNGRRADVMGIDAKGMIHIIEVKVCRADLLGDRKWAAYAEYCDYYSWAVWDDLAPLMMDDFAATTAGLYVGDRYDAAQWRAPVLSAMAPARRKAEMIRLARLAFFRAAGGDSTDSGDAYAMAAPQK